MSLTSRILLALAAGLGGGILLSVIDRPSLFAIASAVEPLGTLWVSALQMTVIPLVVSLLVTGIASATQAQAMGRLGAKALVLFLVLLTAAAAFTALAAPPLFSWLSIDPATAASLRQDVSMTSEGPAVLPRPSQWITGLVPTNPIAAAAAGAMLPLLVFTILFGFAALHAAPASRELLVGFFRSVAEVMLVLVRWILVLAPIGVFGLALPLGLQMGLSAVGAIAYYVLVLSGFALATLFVLYPVAAALGGVPLPRFARAAAPAQAVAFSTQSSLASLPAMIEGAVTRLDISPRIAGFVLPLGVSLFRITGPVWQILGALFIARLYGIDLTPFQVATVAGIAVVMSMAGVGLPGGAGMMVAVPAFLAVGLPPQGIGLLIAIMALPDTIITAANVTAHMAVATILGRRPAIPAAAGRGGALEQPSAATGAGPAPAPTA
ncbi:MAG TPA: cation:dicarboxylase symporter family transporter [Longimicrobiaceae bacterium]|nr:cation:dicarboxylase symporter family transporter [Longimicrobiaceae bacterium]